MDANPDLNLDAMALPHLFRVLANEILHAQRRIAGADRMILVRQRRSEERHDAVAHYLVDRAFVAMHRVHHVREHRVDDDFRLFRVALGEQLQ
jgi:hypothetical protein